MNYPQFAYNQYYGQIPMPMQQMYIPMPQEEQTKKNYVVKGPWLLEEDECLRRAVSMSSPILWDVVAKSVRGRTPKQCRERWMYRLQPELKKTHFEKWEDELIFEQKKKIGNRWTQIALQLPGRTSCSVKNRWYTVLRNKYRDVSDENNSSDHNTCPAAYSIDSLLNSKNL
ncbi:Myb-like DNA-binding domain containing protein [Trichomonas vaginalis G3]|uniref:Myb-like DNA-binding domain containing protein n=1 Tax=Trichomonas vaginalis (strain ATCC PRA-98 / G3) TaxID=412133 RepID=A2F684_TRIV3|nr:RNA polymerase II transcription regulator recruiting protein [Trichomonas vaginalis G3]EAX99601.1 Myb-like DNA-binding domain containing protein [Trichomonas vaginalis G3]KAI5506442.1 RNA polymerase II transcription regulator recruiting protein [Trichomonas vaginalis G3]|eukprot:XP_001312531.1 Myb-like DNA-binding domain containing protein [Trichomonas vaginalis G3]